MNDSIETKIKYQQKIIYALVALFILSVSFLLIEVNQLNENINKLEESINNNKENIDSNFNNLITLNVGTQSVFDEKVDAQLLCIKELTTYLYNLNYKITLIEPRNTIFSTGNYILDIESFFPSQGYFYSECFEHLQN